MTLPTTCYGIHYLDGSLILLKAGETGYWPTEGYSLGICKTWDEVADLLNSMRDVSKAQRAAMEAGSVFGFDCPGADPTRYDSAGRYISMVRDEGAEPRSRHALPGVTKRP